MEQIIRFLLDNIVIVVIILGFISSLMTRAGGSGERGKGMPTFGGGGTAGKRQEQRTQRPGGSTDRTYPEQRKPVPVQTVQQKPKREPSTTATDRTGNQPVQPSYVDRHVQPSYVDRRSPEQASTSASASQGLMKRERQEATPIGDASSPIYLSHEADELRKQVVQGMIWSEVFGKPVAKRGSTRRF